MRICLKVVRLNIYAVFQLQKKVAVFTAWGEVMQAVTHEKVFQLEESLPNTTQTRSSTSDQFTLVVCVGGSYSMQVAFCVCRILPRVKVCYCILYESDMWNLS